MCKSTCIYEINEVFIGIYKQCIQSLPFKVLKYKLCKCFSQVLVILWRKINEDTRPQRNKKQNTIKIKEFLIYQNILLLVTSMFPFYLLKLDP